MQSLLSSTYEGVAIEAIKSEWDGAWERLIAKRLRIDYKSDHSESVVLIDAQSPDPKLIEELQLVHKSIAAAYLITSSTIQTHESKTISETN